MSNNYDQLREIAINIAARAKADATFKEQIQNDPVKTLTAAGLPEKAIPDFLRETGMTDVAGYAAQACLATCFFLSM